jgi:hypothetical protein
MMTATARTAITPGRPWSDTSGNRIQAHGGSILEVEAPACFGAFLDWHDEWRIEDYA